MARAVGRWSPSSISERKASTTASRLRRPRSTRPSTAGTPPAMGGTLARGPLPPPLQDRSEDGRAVGHDAVDAEVEEPLHLGGLVDGPHVHGEARPMGGGDEPTVGDGQAAVPEGDL